MNLYVMGFLFSDDKVLLIRKNRPKDQIGLLNGIGGHIEKGESPLEAMNRECLEECGLKVDWNQYVSIRAKDYSWMVFVFRAWTNTTYFNSHKQLTDEKLEIVKINELSKSRIYYNLSWLIPMALDHRTYEKDWVSSL